MIFSIIRTHLKKIMATFLKLEKERTAFHFGNVCKKAKIKQCNGFQSRHYNSFPSLQVSLTVKGQSK